ncbi:MAG: hypothetical protein DPW18_20575, partial [Chloroflexi bacterium]|nr:hypothetical protein [Chloroflexota bacterium]
MHAPGKFIQFQSAYFHKKEKSMKYIARFFVLIAILVSLLASAPPLPARAAGGVMLTVTTNADTNAVDGFCSLREAITAANNDADQNECVGSGGSYGDDSIVFSVGSSSVITLSSALPAITTTMYIDGFNSGNQVVIDGNNAVSPFYVTTASGNLTLERLTVKKGYASSGEGGALLNNGATVTILNAVFTQNRASSSGGAVATTGGGTTTIKYSSFYANESTGGDGGAIANYGSPVSTTTTIINSTIFNNTASGAGAVINNAGTLSIYNSTLSGNSSSGTFAGSLGTWNGIGPGNDPSTYVYNSILANSAPNDCYNGAGTITGSHNIVESQYTTTCSSIILSNADPGLGTATGSPAYLPISAGSPAMDAGDNATCTGIEVNNQDQRGFIRPIDGDGNSTATCDIGSFEFAPLLLVDDSATSGTNTGLDWANALVNLQDALNLATNGTEIWVANGVYYPDEGSLVINNDRSSSFDLRDGVKVYGGFAGTETVRSQRNIASNIAVLTGDIDKDDENTDGNFINESVDHIFGSNAYHVVSIHDAGGGTILDGFVITGGYANGAGIHRAGGGIVLYSAASPTLENLTITGNVAWTGGADGFGGGVYMEGNSTPSMTNMYIANNYGYFGGGLFSVNSSPVVQNATIANNRAGFGGGVEYFDGSGGSLTNVTIYNNAAEAFNGGGFYNADSSPTLTNVTISNNTAPATYGGGFHNIDTDTYASPAKPVLVNVVIANSTGGDCVTSTLGSGTDASLDAASGYNLIEDSVNACGLSDGVNGNRVGTDPMLGAFANNGGFAPTMMLNPGSPAINSGTNTSCPSTDQRGRSRALTVSDPCDMGAYELQAGQSTFYSNGTHDGWILESSETSGAGGTMNSSAATFNLGDDAANRQYRTILHFDTSA